LKPEAFMPPRIRKDDSFLVFVKDQLSTIPEITPKAMFGGHGLYCGTVFFAIVYAGRLYFKTSEDIRPRYIEQGSGPFRPSDKQTLKAYYEVPTEVLEDPDTLSSWARESIAYAERMLFRSKSRM
jgi:DNA transformation protein and related proteins